MPDGKTFYVTLTSGAVQQVDNVIGVSILSPVLCNSTYRNKPSLVPGGAAVIAAQVDTTTTPDTVSPIGAPATIAGGVDPVVATTGASISTASVVGASSVLVEDAYTGKPPRFVYDPEALLLFQIDDVSFTMTYPTATEGATQYTPGTATTPAVLAFRWKYVKCWNNVAPQGWINNP